MPGWGGWFGLGRSNTEETVEFTNSGRSGFEGGGMGSYGMKDSNIVRDLQSQQLSKDTFGASWAEGPLLSFQERPTRQLRSNPVFSPKESSRPPLNSLAASSQSSVDLAMSLEPSDGDYSRGLTGSQELGEGEKHSVCFPLVLCPCASWLPNRWHTIVDWTHLFIIVGILCAAAMIANPMSQFWEYLNGGAVVPCKADAYCTDYRAKIAALLPNLVVFIILLCTYDQDINSQTELVMAQRQEVMDTYEDVVHGIDDLLGKATQTSAMLAEGGFETKRRDFVRFLDHAEEKGRRLAWQADGELLAEFKRFVDTWLNVFSEASVDPLAKPLFVVTTAEIEQQKNISDVAKFVKERLAGVQVRFISEQTAQDRQFLSSAKSAEQALGGGLALPADDYDNVGRDEEKTGVPWPCCPCEWFLCSGHGCRCFCCSPEGEDVESGKVWFPRSSQGACFRINILSRTHFCLIFGFFASIALLVSAAYEWTRYHLLDIWAKFLPVVVIAVVLSSVAVVLVNFEHIDVIKKINKHIQKVKEEAERLQQRRDQMVGFWGKVQTLTDIWVHRTAPRLDLLKEVHIHLATIADPDTYVGYLRDINDQFEALEDSLGSLELWQEGGKLDTKVKKQFAKNVRKVYEKASASLAEILERLAKLVHEEANNLWGGGSASIDQKVSAYASPHHHPRGGGGGSAFSADSLR